MKADHLQPATVKEAQAFTDQARQEGQKIILVTGVFDLLHAEHKTFLKKAKAAGQVLVVGVECDTRVRKIKGEGRPIWSEQQRVAAVQTLPSVDLAFVLPTQFSQPADHEQLIAALKPDVLAVSSHSDHLAAKQAILKKYGGKVVVVHQHNPAISTSQLLAKRGTLS